MAGDPARRFDHFPHTESLPVPDVVVQAGARAERLQGQDVRIGQVADVNIVADAGAIRRRIVLAEDLDALSAPQGYVEDQRDEVRFRLMRLTASLYRACDVEITEAGIAQTVDSVHPRQHVLYQPLALAIGIGLRQCGVLLDRRALRLTVNSGGGRDVHT